MASYLTEIIFNGSRSKLNFTFLQSQLLGSSNVRLNSHDITISDSTEILKLLKGRGYVDVAIDSFKLDSIANVFVNLVVDEGRVELLFFLDLNDLSNCSPKEAVEYLMNWAIKFSMKSNFDEVVCQPEHQRDNNYYFKGSEFGICFDDLY